ncbi:ATP-grasp domain-containing protein [Actinopolymorpha sp. B11F2]|uniref:ATP-grasp domain-containing protein n=1 Tax=Actinopolymorpha sp. B11F2 TaxID=3160862 RepID=UPI0032E40B89
MLDAFEGSVEAVVGYWDFPVSSMVPLLCRARGLRSASLEAVLKCEHKYWSRIEQQKVIDAVPRFALIDLEAPSSPPSGLDYPMWLKPVKSYGSELAFHVGSDEEFRKAVIEIRDGIARIGGPFEFVMDQVELPSDIAEVGGQACLAEEALRGDQVTLEGFCREGAVTIYGVVDSVTYAESPSFLRYQYPSRLPAQVLGRTEDLTRRVIAQVGLTDSTFNVEFFHDAERDDIRLLEVNPRHSQSHAQLFEQVDGVSNHECMLRLAVGRDPDLPHGKGPYDVAAKWFLRRFSDGEVRRCPTAEQVAQLEREVPGATVQLLVREGDRLSNLHGQDSYSYQLAHVYVGADSEDDLVGKFDRCVDGLSFEIDDVPGV